MRKENQLKIFVFIVALILSSASSSVYAAQEETRKYGQKDTAVVKVALAEKDTVTIGSGRDKIINLAIEKDAASEVVDSNGSSIIERLSKVSAGDVKKCLVTFRKDSLPKIFEKTINLKSAVKATVVCEVNGVISLRR